MKIQKASRQDVLSVAELAVALWPGHTREEFVTEYAQLIDDAECAIFLSFCESFPAGFAQIQLRHDYVEGAETSPVGYLEGIFVREAHRGRGVAQALLTACEDWAKGMGCAEFASDCELENTASQSFHRSVGFSEANRIVCFTKKL